MTHSVNMSFTCPHCNKDVDLNANIDPIQLAPTVRAVDQGVAPAGAIFVYKISSEQIKQFITTKAKLMIPDVKVEVVPKYCERKQRRPSDPHRSYASLRIAFSDHILEKKGDDGWYGKIGETNSNIQIVQSMFDNIIRRYRYDRKAIEGWLKSYKNLEELEEALGMTEKYINDLRLYSTPQRVSTANKESWIIFSAAAENVIMDMLSDPATGRPQGRVQIQDVYRISKDVVEFLIYVHPTEIKLKENPHVRQILLGEEKPKG